MYVYSVYKEGGFIFFQNGWQIFSMLCACRCVSVAFFVAQQKQFLYFALFRDCLYVCLSDWLSIYLPLSFCVYVCVECAAAASDARIVQLSVWWGGEKRMSRSKVNIKHIKWRLTGHCSHNMWQTGRAATTKATFVCGPWSVNEQPAPPQQQKKKQEEDTEHLLA